MSDLPDDPDRGAGVQVLDLLKARLLSVVLLLVLGAVALTYFAGIWSPPRFVWIGLLTAVCGVAFGLLVGTYGRTIVGSTNWYWLVDLDARQMDAAIFRMPQRKLANFEVTEGDLDNPAPSIYFGKNVDPDAQTVEGTWRGTLTDRELLRCLQAIRTCKGQLKEDAKVGFTLSNNLYAIVRSAVVTNTRRIVHVFEHGTLPDKGESIESAVEEAIEDFTHGEDSLDVTADGLLDQEGIDLDSLTLDQLKELSDSEADVPDQTDPLNYSTTEASDD